ncbi:MAG: alpha/beta fold hydrolase [Sedimenticolaceae bacterium]
MTAPPPDRARPWVVLLHGMARSSASMSPLAGDLRRAGYQIRNVGYPTRSHDIARLVERYVRPAVQSCGERGAVHVVTHSLGGILIRFYLQAAALPGGSRIVMLAPPNHGSEVVDHVRHWLPYRWLMGQVGQQLGTGPDSIVNQLGPIKAEIGVIAARRSLQPWFSPLFSGENDGAVSVASARLAEMRDFIVVDSSHTLLMFSREVRRQIREFLAHGRFLR